MVSLLRSCRHDRLHPGVYTLIRRWITHVEHLVVESSLLRAAVAEQQNAVFNRHQAIPRTVHQQQPTGRPVHDPALHKAEILLRVLLELFPVLIPVFQDVRVAQDKRVLVVVDAVKPLS